MDSSGWHHISWSGIMCIYYAIQKRNILNLSRLYKLVMKLRLLLASKRLQRKYGKAHNWTHLIVTLEVKYYGLSSYHVIWQTNVNQLGWCPYHHHPELRYAALGQKTLWNPISDYNAFPNRLGRWWFFAFFFFFFFLGGGGYFGYNALKIKQVGELFSISLLKNCQIPPSGPFRAVW